MGPASCKKCFPHPLGPLPWSLAATDGSLKNTWKTSRPWRKSLQCTDLCRLQDCGKRYEDPTETVAEIDYESNNYE